MAESSTEQGYAPLSILLHWLMLVLLAGVYVAAELQEGGEDGSAFETWHVSLGLAVFFLVWVRILARVRSPSPPPVDGGWRNLAAKVTHGTLYALMIGMPMVGWLILSAEGETAAFFGLALPPLTSPDHGFAEWLEEVHEVGGQIGYGLVGLHAAAALVHHYLLRDGVMARMLPGRASTPR